MNARIELDSGGMHPLMFRWGIRNDEDGMKLIWCCRLVHTIYHSCGKHFRSILALPSCVLENLTPSDIVEDRVLPLNHVVIHVVEVELTTVYFNK